MSGEHFTSAQWLASLAEKGGKGVVDNIDARSLGRIGKLLTETAAERDRLCAEVEQLEKCNYELGELNNALRAEMDGWKASYVTTEKYANDLAALRATLSKRPVAFRAPNGKGGWVVTQDEQEAIDVADGADYQGLYVRDGT